jgi:hypothetical protein
MKKLLLFGLLLSGLGSCSKGGDDPKPVLAEPGLVGNAWVFQSEVNAATPKNGGATITSTRSIPVGAYSLVFGSDGKFTTATSPTQVVTGTYTYVGKTLTIPYLTNNGQKSQVLTVIELTPTKLVTTESTEDTSSRYLTTDTFTR